ncbi:Mrp/NBP35 family ATP-binding protein [Sulfobacillus thermosulfidooxidans]|uniref:Mrp/NBP35 family ATP-binding protein n=1 Tax=Sulfobacillus thermosulfidooxidans TaxID=28034 RepID=UPI000408C537|nr:Mrp/NBP35 family ATP-binding protein [Sulfobacillus thermosulfidooxidans]
MLDQARVMRALENVYDPELHQSIVALNMVRNVAIEPSGRVALDIALTVEGCPLHQKITDDVNHVLRQDPEVTDVAVNLSVMNEQERKKAFQKAFESAQHNRAQGATSAKPNVTPPTTSSNTRQAPVIGPLPGQGPAEGMMSDANKTVVIGIASGKGGVGKSTITANLAVALNKLGARVGIIDMDIYGFSQGRMFGAKDKARVNEQEKIIPWQVHGVYLVSMGMFVEEGQAIVWRGPMLGKMMQQFFTDVAWPELDYLLIDLPPGTGDVALDIAQKVRKAKLVLVTTPQEVATYVAHRAGDVAKRAHQEIIGVIENMSYVLCPHGDRMNIFGSGGGKALADLFRVPLLGQIPLESTVREGGDEGEPVVVSDPESLSSHVFLDIAARIKHRIEEEAAG